jgi:nitrogen-specific signal transduction histidine kinase
LEHWRVNCHEINNPLTGIINNAQIIYERLSDETLREFARGIIDEGERVRALSAIY